MIQDLIKAAAAAAASASNSDDEHLTDVQMATQLKEIAAKLEERHNFLPGDVVRHKYPDRANVRGAGDPRVFIRYLDEPIKAWEFVTEPSDFGSTSAAEVLDCIMISFMNGKAVPFLQSSESYGPHPDFPRT